MSNVTSRPLIPSGNIEGKGKICHREKNHRFQNCFGVKLQVSRLLIPSGNIEGKGEILQFKYLHSFPHCFRVELKNL